MVGLEEARGAPARPLGGEQQLAAGQKVLPQHAARVDRRSMRRHLQHRNPTPDGRADHDDWTEAAIGPFGGWKVGDVAMKQFNGTTQMCGINVDLDWRFHTTARR